MKALKTHYKVNKMWPFNFEGQQQKLFLEAYPFSWNLKLGFVRLKSYITNITDFD